MKTFTSSSFDKPLTGTRTEAIKQAIDFLKPIAQNHKNHRYTWRADDESGFTIQINNEGQVALKHKWNAAR